ncbi:Copper-transporting ATPase PAA1, chloroplastic [Sesamum angolense]|uniref:Copper-transporting ATPase PAA1, chloroplastic n=1 Tax=Sesamum angolense TaxID=2727404 RepID=A0AAE1WZ08_9LAMI|nr:Copper-transporting ATPase PAA1, chloroplastic [Sesamum angolense]
MESTLLSAAGVSTMSIFSLSKSLNSHSAPLILYLHRRLSTSHPTRLAHAQLRRCAELSRTAPGSLVKGPGSLCQRRDRLRFAARSAASFAAGGGGFGGVDGGAGGGGGGDGAAEGGDAKPGAVAPGAADNPALSSDVIILDVGIFSFSDVAGDDMWGCAASVKRILESQPQVSSASVNLTTETAIVWPVSEVKVAPNWQKDIGEALAKHLTSCGFKSNLRGLLGFLKIVVP